MSLSELSTILEHSYGGILIFNHLASGNSDSCGSKRFFFDFLSIDFGWAEERLLLTLAFWLFYSVVWEYHTN